MARIAIIGTGRMGTAFAKRLIETGNTVVVWNRTQDRTKAAAEAGAEVAQSLSDLGDCDAILLSLQNADAVGSVATGLIASGVSGRLVVDTSTLLPDDTREIAARFAEAGADFVDCPVGGTVGPALKGQLLGMAGGTEAAFERARPIMEQLCKRVEHLGPAGSGAHMKLAVNLPLAIYWQTLGEALAMLVDSGIPADVAISVISDSSAGPAVLKNRGQVVIDTLNGTDQPGTFDLAGLSKDLGLALEQASRKGRRMPLSEAAQKSYAAALAVGLDGFDGATLTRFVLDK
ncbi:NAD(P)-dependent oxidoreductase [Silicimonas sp. MF1-12-2]|uniref:NAD(P)-dependent oxidoreductase n=1 Tax=Silicimonas sp. MF1-12-2 TaxID=3384793 RepID=UPI0039B37135